MTTASEVLDAAGPEQIRTAFSTAIDTTTGHAGDLTGIAGTLADAADHYEALAMTTSTLEHLRDGAAAVTAAAAALSTAEEQLQAALADFDAHDGRVGDAVTEAGNLMQPEGYTTTFRPTGDQEQPMTQSPAAAPPTQDDTVPAAPDDRSDRDRLARGYYLHGWPESWRLDRAREWDAGRADEQAKADAYEVADQVIAGRSAIAAGPGAGRLEVMRDNGVTRCPSWCPQPDDEEQDEAHVGPGRTFTTGDGDTVTVRPRVSWWPETEPAVEIAITPVEGGDGSLVLDPADLARLQQLSAEVMSEAQHQHRYAPDDATKPAYPGAALDEADTAHDLSAPAAAAAALDRTSRASGYYFHESDDLPEPDDSAGTGPYLDWSGRDSATRVRNLEVGDGTATGSLGLDLNGDDLRDLRDHIGRLVGAVDDGQEDPGALRPRAEDDNGYIDWSCVVDGGRSVEFGDGVDAVVLEMPGARLQEWYERLALQVQLDEQGDPA